MKHYRDIFNTPQIRKLSNMSAKLRKICCWLHRYNSQEMKFYGTIVRKKMNRAKNQVITVKIDYSSWRFSVDW